MRVYLVKQIGISRVRYIAVPIVSIVLAFCLVSVLLLLIGVNPLAVFAEIIATSTSRFGFGNALAQAAPLIFTSLAVAFAFRMKVYSIGAEGQLIMGAIFSAATGILMAGQPAVVIIPAALAAGAVGGCLWSLVPSFLYTYFNVSVIITTLLLNFVAYYVAAYLILGSNSFLTEKISNFPQGRSIAEEARLPYLGDESVTWAIVFALAASVCVWLVLAFTRFGYNMRVCGDSPNAGTYAGLSVRRMTNLVMAASGALAGLAGTIEITGRTYGLDPFAIAVGLGYTGIVVALVARLNPFGIILTALLFGALVNSGSSLQGLSENSVPAELISVITGLILLLLLLGDVFIVYRLKFKFGV